MKQLPIFAIALLFAAAGCGGLAFSSNRDGDSGTSDGRTTFPSDAGLTDVGSSDAADSGRLDGDATAESSNCPPDSGVAEGGVFTLASSLSNPNAITVDGTSV
jgi:hypothetical protein